MTDAATASGMLKGIVEVHNFSEDTHAGFSPAKPMSEPKTIKARKKQLRPSHTEKVATVIPGTSQAFAGLVNLHLPQLSRRQTVASTKRLDTPQFMCT